MQTPTMGTLTVHPQRKSAKRVNGNTEPGDTSTPSPENKRLSARLKAQREDAMGHPLTKYLPDPKLLETQTRGHNGVILSEERLLKKYNSQTAKQAMHRRKRKVLSEFPNQGTKTDHPLRKNA